MYLYIYVYVCIKYKFGRNPSMVMQSRATHINRYEKVL